MRIVEFPRTRARSGKEVSTATVPMEGYSRTGKSVDSQRLCKQLSPSSQRNPCNMEGYFDGESVNKRLEQSGRR